MIWREFVVDLVRAVAWPVVVLIIFLVLRTRIFELISRLKSARHGETQFEFGQGLNHVEEAVDSLTTPVVESPEGRAVRDLADVAPRAAVIEAWLLVERELRRLAGKAGEGSVSLHSLVRKGLLNEEFANVVRELRNLRSAAVHSETFTIPSDEARRYAESAQRIAAALRAMRQVTASDVPGGQ